MECRTVWHCEVLDWMGELVGSDGAGWGWMGRLDGGDSWLCEIR